ncbi:MAG: penicillin-binding protein 2 [Gammaproteobacteria bacterium]|nr:MAG: penicillin-binding protein 2 [Gammaproteobacteria bacterium]
MSRWRHFALVFTFLTIAAVLVGRIAALNINDSAFLKRQGDARSVRVESLAAHRGIVFDRHGEPLAVSTPVVSVWIDPSATRLDANQRRALARTLAIDVTQLAERQQLYRNKSFMYVARRVTPDLANTVADLGITGVRFKREYRRYYPAGELAAHVVGFTDIDDRGQEGVELSFDKHLRGIAGRKKVLKDRRGQIVRDLEYLAAPQFGNDLRLSIDLRLQFFAYRELKSAVEHHRAVSGSVVMLDVRTGEILALVNQPSFNPNGISRIDHGAMRNRAITDLYEPGSTVKPLTIIAALESGRFSPNSSIDTAPGYVRVGKKLIEDPVNRGRISLREVLEKSSQVGIAKVALKLEKRAVFDVFTRAGFGTYPGSGLPGEVAGRLSDAELNNPIVRATMAYGYGISVTPLQLAQAYLGLATLGQSLPVSILRLDSAPEMVRVFDERDVRALVGMMQGVATATGTAPKARVPGYRVAGKTGTTRKVGATGYDDSRHVAFFAGMAPVENPRVVVVVVVNEPKGERVGGGDVAAPVFARIVARALRVLGVAPETEMGRAV